MERVFRLAQWVLVRACLVLGTGAAVVGCKSACSTGECVTHHGHHGHLHSHPNAHLDNCSDIPQGAIPQPLGTFSNAILARQAEKGEADAYVIYSNEWLDGQAALGPYGRDHLVRMIARLPVVSYPIILQLETNYEDPGPIDPKMVELTEQRRQALVKTLTEAGIPEAERRVLVGRPWGEGLFGEEAERIYPQLVRGGFAGFGGGGFAGFGGGGFNMGGFGGGFGGFAGGFGGGGLGFGGGGFGFR